MTIGLHGSVLIHKPMQAQLGDIVFVELPEVGAELEKEGQFGVVESVKVGHCSWHRKSIAAR